MIFLNVPAWSRFLFCSALWSSGASGLIPTGSQALCSEHQPPVSTERAFAGPLFWAVSLPARWGLACAGTESLSRALSLRR